MLIPFLSANGVYASLIAGALSINAEVSSFVFSNLIPVTATGSLLEVATILVVWHVYGPNTPKRDPTLSFDAGIEQIVIRFATTADADGTEAVYLEWFSESLSIDDAEFNKITSREVHVRVAEAVYQGGSREIIGYYSIWPMSYTNYVSLIEGKIKESSFTSSMILPPSSSQAQVVYISEICARKDSGGAGTMLMKDARSYVNAIARRNGKISTIAAWGSTNIGRSIATRMCMSRVKKSNGKLTWFYAISRTEAFKVVGNAAAFRPSWAVTYG